MRDLSPRVNLSQANSRIELLIRRFSPPSPTRGEGKKRRAYFAFLAFFAFAAFFSGFCFAFFSTFATTGVLAAIRIDRA